MLAKIYSFGILGLDAYPVTIEVDVSPGLPAFHIVGLPDNAIRESKERIRAAIRNCELRIPPRRVTVNLAPADIKKEGPSFDLAMALGILAGSEQISMARLNRYIFLGELSLDGTIKAVRGALPSAIGIKNARLDKHLILPYTNAQEAALCPDVTVIPVGSLQETIYFLQNPDTIPPYVMTADTDNEPAVPYPDFSDVKGQAHVKRGLEVAAAGGHNALMIGPPGSGKSMLAQRLPGILPDLTVEEMLDITQIYSVAGLLTNKARFISQRPFRSPHHTSSNIALIGGGPNPKPGEVSLSHHGILFLDEMPEFPRSVLEGLRQPLEDRTITISRAARTLQFPARFMLVGAMNPCPCGWLTDSRRNCQCHPQQVQRYISRISGPLMDRIDLHLETYTVSADEMLTPQTSEPSIDIKRRVLRARDIQKERYRNGPVRLNAHASRADIRRYAGLSKECQALLKQAMHDLNLSARAHDKIVKVARTISDLDGTDDIKTDHLAEAIQYRSLDRS